MSFVKVGSSKSYVLVRVYNSGGLGVEFHQCPDDGDEVVH
jgi:hypothetical protein